MKIKFVSLLVVIVFLLNCGSITHNEPQIYVSGMEPMMDKDTNAVLAEIEDEWKFQCSKFWTSQNPTLQDVSREIKGEPAFTEQEASQIFSPKGEYKVMIYYKLLKTDKIYGGTISSMGMSLPQANEKNVDKSHAYISLVFRDNKLVYFHVWHD
ncbi:MAG: hypothetical protein MUP98_01405 [Candidatus Aminicenantes bacterium]|nr:hypothetical protein [Candidatus Aminicenantes bacterium]